MYNAALHIEKFVMRLLLAGKRAVYSILTETSNLWSLCYESKNGRHMKLEYFQECITDLFLEDKGGRNVKLGCKLTNVAAKLGD